MGIAAWQLCSISMWLAASRQTASQPVVASVVYGDGRVVGDENHRTRDTQHAWVHYHTVIEKNVHIFYFAVVSTNTDHFYNIWHTLYWRNLQHNAYWYVHFTYILLLHYLGKNSELLVLGPFWPICSVKMLLSQSSNLRIKSDRRNIFAVVSCRDVVVMREMQSPSRAIAVTLTSNSKTVCQLTMNVSQLS